MLSRPALVQIPAPSMIRFEPMGKLLDLRVLGPRPVQLSDSSLCLPRPLQGLSLICKMFRGMHIIKCVLRGWGES